MNIHSLRYMWFQQMVFFKKKKNECRKLFLRISYCRKHLNTSFQSNLTVTFPLHEGASTDKEDLKPMKLELTDTLSNQLYIYIYIYSNFQNIYVLYKHGIWTIQAGLYPRLNISSFHPSKSSCLAHLLYKIILLPSFPHFSTSPHLRTLSNPSSTISPLGLFP